MGLMHAWYIRFAAEKAAGICRPVVGAAGRTTTLSAAWLRSAAVGEAGEPWHRLVDAAGLGDEPGLRSAIRQILAAGHTSGADALAGFTAGLIAR
jgi:hypothetical protein